MNFRPRRSALYLPASSEKAIAKARSLPCDVLILDLEDAVAPDAKSTARKQAVAAVQEGGFGNREVVIRVNGLTTEWGEEDLAAVSAVAADAILVPKVSSGDEIKSYSDRLSQSKAPLWAMIETAKSLFRLDEIGSTAAAGRLTGFVMGTNDLAKELGAQPGTLRTPFLGALGLAVAAARANGLVIFDGVFNDLDDAEGFVAQTRQGVEFGFDGKTLIHPSQIDPCNQAFTPDAASLAWAKRIIEAFDDPANADKGAIRLDGKMVERLHLHQARRALAAGSIS